ncbi:hypothetical protein D9K79_05495 [Acinetobacter cumulans]|uniref:Uncharacterized protein n=1 Tax=Acinetobacter cumulans TaxID=2136182 RepID=A0ABX9U7N8_9GAMM|nr:hypothetical protein D7V51_02695 [Acinetobacter cumulans]RLL47616.1 hypothetical protein D9K79_05495 [Acinetobacter cumulans]
MKSLYGHEFSPVFCAFKALNNLNVAKSPIKLANSTFHADPNGWQPKQKTECLYSVLHPS